ncbi:acetyl-CoA carboxylase biotin carboxyl carrier protein [Lachnospiraceae bacterium ZAX-1]
MDFLNIIQLIETVSNSHLTQFSYEQDGVVIKMRTDKEQKHIAAMNPANSVNAQGLNGYGIRKESADGISGQGAFVENASGISSQAKEHPDGHSVKSPLVGIYYASASPEEEPFVKVGDHVAKGQVLGIIEAMKLMNEIESEYDGIVKKILVSNEQVIEFDQMMFVIE